MAVHDVQVQRAGPGILEPPHLVGQMPEVAEQQRGIDHGRRQMRQRAATKEGDSELSCFSTTCASTPLF